MTRPTLVAGVDSSTQSTKVLVVDAATGVVVREGRAAHPDGTEVDPEHWWAAFSSATAGGLLDDVAAISVSAQQHGMVALDDDGAVVRPALLWNDTRSADAAAALVEECGGPAAWADEVGTVPLAAITVSKLRWFAEHESDAAARTAQVVLPHDWVTARILGHDRMRPGEVTTDRGDASGTGYWSPESGSYREDLLVRAFGRAVAVPRVLGPTEAAGETPFGMLVAAGTGDNMGAALGLGLRPGDVVVSLGTSGTVFSVHDRATHDPSGFVAGFADASGAFLPLVCTLNAARVLGATADLLGTDLAGLSDLALAAAPGAGGLTLLPYLDGERTPDLPDSTGTLGGLTRDSMTPANLARASVEGMLCGLAEGLDALVRQGVSAERVVLIGGAARSPAVQAVAPEVFGVPVVVPPAAEYVALGAARQAAEALAAAGGPAPGEWSQGGAEVVEPHGGAAGARVRAAHADLRTRMHP
ncbi:xylulokinase [Nocardioides acrostichi]|uniref:Xylulose kinase n=1 Tax=Nocardioides acrostichi TaxID=2784339 RepID=A0A930UZ16_9ACTN|nr:xylulokinase [Nocardioides acrostichi]MBF4163518.1 xylulokinase [Nocardioides acrostichi]